MWGPMAKTASANHPIQVESSEEGSGLHRLQVKVPAERVRQEFDHTYKALARRVKLPGFRPGKVPVQVLRKHFGDSVVEDARDHLFEHVINDALRESGLSVLRVLDFKPEDHAVSEDSDLEFEFRVECAPQIELPPWEEVKIEARPVAAEEEQIRKAFESLGFDHPRFEDAGQQGLDEEHMAESELVYLRDGEEGPAAENLRLTLGSPLYGTEPAAYEAALKGAKAGSELTLPVEFHEGFSKEEWVGGQGEARLKIQRIVKPRPGTPEEVAADLGLENEEELREKVVESLERENAAGERRRQAHEILEAIHGLRPIEIPPRLLEEETEAALKSHTERLEKQGGMSAEEAAAKAAEARAPLAEDSERRLRHYFLIRKVAEAERIRVSRGDLDRAFRALAAQHQADPKAVEAYYREKDMVGGLEREILEGRVRERLLEKASIAPVEPSE